MELEWNSQQQIYYLKKMKIKFTYLNKISFYVSYLYYKTLVCIEVKKPKFSFMFFEIADLINKIFKAPFYIYPFFKISYVETRFGKFLIRKMTEDVVCVSSAFERKDLNYLLKLIKNSIKLKKRILFLDIGADFGTYSITLGNIFRKYKYLDIIAFEPTSASYKLLNTNIKKNKLENKIKTFNIALTNNPGKYKIYYNEKRPGSSSIKEKKGKEMIIKGKTLDSLKINFKLYDLIIAKIDVEGYEENVIRGAGSLFINNSNVHLFIEDFKNQRFIKYLPKKIIFDKKITPYNSWWKSTIT